MSPRDRILARRAKFIAAAFASAGVVACSSAEVSQVPPNDGGVDARSDGSRADTEPQTCLFAPPDEDTGAAPVDTGTGDAPDGADG